MINSRPAADVTVAVAAVNEVPPSSDAVNVMSRRAGCVGPFSPPPPHAAAITVEMASTGRNQPTGRREALEVSIGTRVAWVIAYGAGIAVPANTLYVDDAWSRQRNVAFKLATDPSTSKYGFRVSAEYRD